MRQVKNEKLTEGELLAFKLGVLETKGAVKVFDFVIGDGELKPTNEAILFMEKFKKEYKGLDEYMSGKKDLSIDEVTNFEKMGKKDVWAFVKNVNCFGNETEYKLLKWLINSSENQNVSSCIPETDKKILDQISNDNANVSNSSNRIHDCISIEPNSFFRDKIKLTERIKSSPLFNNQNIKNLENDMRNLHFGEVKYLNKRLSGENYFKNESDFISEQTRKVIFDKMTENTRLIIFDEIKKMKIDDNFEFPKYENLKIKQHEEDSFAQKSKQLKLNKF